MRTRAGKGAYGGELTLIKDGGTVFGSHDVGRATLEDGDIFDKRPVLALGRSGDVIQRDVPTS